MQSVLVVDDHPEIRRLLSVILGKGQRVLEADNGVTALEVVRAEHPRVVLLDVMMPGDMDGLQVLTAIKSDPFTQSTRVAIISARGQQSDREAAVKLGADAYFIKPFSPLEVVRWVQTQMA